MKKVKTSIYNITKTNEIIEAIEKLNVSHNEQKKLNFVLNSALGDRSLASEITKAVEASSFKLYVDILGSSSAIKDVLSTYNYNSFCETDSSNSDYRNVKNGNSKNGKFKNGDKYYYRLRSKNRKQQIRKERTLKEKFSIVQ